MHNERKSIQTSSVISCSGSFESNGIWKTCVIWPFESPCGCITSLLHLSVSDFKHLYCTLGELVRLLLKISHFFCLEEELKANEQKAEWGLIASYVLFLYNISMIIIENSITYSTKKTNMCLPWAATTCHDFEGNILMLFSFLCTNNGSVSSSLL